MTDWLREHTLITYILIFVMVAYVYHKVFATRKLPLLKLLLVYAAMAFGCYILLIFQIFGLPIVLCIAVALLLMLMTGVRAYAEKRQNRNASSQSQK
ncbi:YlaH-like family protein [Paenibacillus chartarius]|uniref:YlaH-like family protein n=1 Tax=Paenibacillus chartarius TaxID=747481 RepID=A0ABV6DUL1_9BACL